MVEFCVGYYDGIKPERMSRMPVPHYPGRDINRMIESFPEAVPALARPSLELMAHVMDMTADAILLVDLETKYIVYANKSAMNLYGFSREDLPSIRITDFSPKKPYRIIQWMKQVYEAYPCSQSFRTRHQTREGRILEVDISAKFITLGGRPCFLFVVRDLSRTIRSSHRLRSSVQKLRQAAFVDNLTGAWNRHYFVEKVLPRLSCPCSMLLLDIDRFKLLNDTYGHLFGDAVLVQLVAIIKSCVRSKDPVIRFGGEEFLIVLPDVGPDRCFEVAERIRLQVSEHRFTNKKLEAHVTVSIGALAWDDRCPLVIPQFINDLLHQLDNLLYKSKTQGRNRTSFGTL